MNTLVNTSEANNTRGVQTFSTGTLAEIAAKGGTLPATLEVFKKNFPRNELMTLTPEEYGKAESCIQDTLKNPYSLSVLIDFRNNMISLLERKLREIYNSENYIYTEAYTVRHIDRDKVPTIDDNQSENERKAINIMDAKFRTGAERIVRHLTGAIEQIKQGTPVDTTTLISIIDEILEKTDGSSYGYTSGSLIQLYKGDIPPHLPLVIGERLHRVGIYSSYKNRTSEYMSRTISDVDALYSKKHGEIFESVEGVIGKGHIRVEHILQNKGLTKDEYLGIKYLFNRANNDRLSLIKIHDSFKGKNGMQSTIISNFQTTLDSFYLNMRLLNNRVGEKNTSISQGENSPSVNTTPLLPFQI